MCLLTDKNRFYKNTSCIHIDKNSKISGIIYSDQSIELKGTVNGRIFTDNFVHTTASSAYKNILIDAEISIKNYNKYFIEPIVFEESNMEILKWLN